MGWLLIQNSQNEQKYKTFENLSKCAFDVWYLLGLHDMISACPRPVRPP